MVTYNPVFAERYAERAFEIYTDRKRTKKKQTIKLSAKNQELLSKVNIKPAPGLFVMPKPPKQTQKRQRAPAKPIVIDFKSCK